MKYDGIRQSHDKQEGRADSRPWQENFSSPRCGGVNVMNMTWRRTDHSTDLSNAIDLISHIGADGDGHILLAGSHR